MINVIKKTTLALSLLLVVSASNTVYAAAKLIFTPQRVVLEGNNRTAALSLSNGGDKTATFRISLSDAIYQRNGEIKHTTKPPAGFPTARPYIRISPRQVRLAPGESQVVRILAKRPPVQNKEYRIHALMQQLPEQEAGDIGSGEKVIKGSTRLMQATAIGIIYRVGKTQATAGIAAAKKTPTGVDLVLSRNGNRSVHTTLEVYKGTQVIPRNRAALVKGLSIPVPNTQRRYSLVVDKPSNQQPYLVVMKDYYSNKILAQSVVK